MAIYKLKELFTYSRGGNDNLYEDLKGAESFPVISAGLNIKRCINVYNRNGIYTCISSSGQNAGKVTNMRGRFFASDCFTLKAKNKLLPTYAQHLLLLMENDFFKVAYGSAQKHVYWRDVSEITVKIPNLERQKKIIDIIEPLEKMTIIVESLMKQISNLILAIPISGTFDLKESVTFLRNRPLGIEQVSARVMKRRSPFIERQERVGTYQTNSFFCPKGTLLINSIRTYLEKFSLLPINSDVNGTLFQMEVEKNATSILHNLLGKSFWKRASSLSKGTKMPTLGKKELLMIPMNKACNDVPDAIELMMLLNIMLITIKKLKEKALKILL